VGKRFTAAVLLRIDPTDLTVFEAPNGVLLTREVPPGAIVWGDLGDGQNGWR
jgi:putative RNA 2'-phosphotransferase